MEKTLTDEQLDRLGKVFVYHTYGLIEDYPGTLPEPRLPFELFVQAWKKGKDLSEILPSIQHYQQDTSRYKNWVTYRNKREEQSEITMKQEAIIS